MKALEIFGDSVLRGVMYSTENQKYNLCSDNKFSSIAQKGIFVKNNSKMGATILKGLPILKKRLQSCEDGTSVLLEYGGNDCDFDWKSISENPNGNYNPHICENEFIDKYSLAIDYARSKGAKVAVMSLVPIDAGKYFDWISRGLNKENILNWLGDISMLSRWQEHYNALVESLAIKKQCPIVDVRSEFLLSHDFNNLLCSDGIHPTQIGHNIINKKIAMFAQAN